jgi:hypothetical protein
MKITKSQLKQIIKEELERVLKESAWHGPGAIAEPAAIDEGGAFASDEDIHTLTTAASKIDSGIRTFNEFYEALRIAWNSGLLLDEPSMPEVRKAWRKHPANPYTHDQRTGIRHR